MALAILELIDSDETGHELQLDTGTNTHFEIRLGDTVSRRAGSRFVDNVFHQTPLTPSEGAGDLLAPPQSFRLAVPPAPGRRVYAQMFTFKPARRAPAFSEVIELPPLLTIPRGFRPSVMQSVDVMNGVSGQQAAVRRVPQRSLSESTSVPFESILAEVLRIAQPIVAAVLKAPPGEASAAVPAADIVGGLLKAVLAAIPGTSGSPAGLPISQTKSLGSANRFNGARSEAFVFGIDDALIAAAIGPLVQILPQLANAANQRDKDRRAADQAFTSGILKDINQRMLMDKILEAQRQAQLNQQWASAGDAPAIKPEDLAALAALISKVGPMAAVPAAPAKPMSFASSRTSAAAAPASRAVLEPLADEPLDWSGGRDPLYARDKRMALRFRFAVAQPAPSKPLERAILTVTLRDDSNPALRAEKSIRLTSVAAGSVLECVFEPGELVHLPAGSRLTATGSLRWRGKARTVEALGSMRLALVGPVFVKRQGSEVGGERELTDMRRWRTFWNKVWESPTLDRSENGKRRWRLDADFRYTVLLGPETSNGFMETRHRAPDEADDPDSAQVIGRIKAGAELGIGSVAQLRPLWDLGDLPADALAAVSDRGFLMSCGGELQRRIELKGRAGERGLLWAIPSFRLFDILLSRVVETGVSGAVTKVIEDKIQLPLPVGVRLIGLKSN